MAHQYNRTAFGSASTNGNKLLALYCSLVQIELALKDQQQASTGTWPSGHNIPTLLAALAALDAGCNALSTQLSTKLNALACRSKMGLEATVNPSAYPDLRYLLHETDFPGKCRETQLEETLDCVRDIQAILHSLHIL